jgi:hypothetical protein
MDSGGAPERIRGGHSYDEGVLPEKSSVAIVLRFAD